MRGSARQILCGLGAALLVFFGLGFLIDWPLWIAGILAVGTYFGVFLISKPRLKIGHIRVDSLPDGNDLKALMLDAKNDMDTIRDLTKKITHLPIRQQSEQLYQTGLNILSYLEKNPDKISLARRFFGYYLDTAVEILQKYLPFQESGLRTEDVRRVTQSTERAMPILNRAFERQFSNLMQNDMMDIEAEIKVLEMNLRSEGGLDSHDEQ